MIAIGKKDEDVPEMTTAGIAQPSDILNAGEGILRVVSYGEVALNDGGANKWAGSFSLHH
jgi:hypothetical protein